ncbi:MAG TPA: FtsQ-type POTRA domain-containing protein [Verrucomicrobiae bacterium]|nr:FtsQ-type POTRA domain-containing protein [Verrucomicrobiae bacterium]
MKKQPPPAPNRVKRPPKERKPINFRRYFRLAAKGMLWTGAAAAALAVTFGLYRLVSSTVFFRLENIEVTRNRRLSREDIILIAGVKAGDDLLGLDLRRIGEQLCKNPWIGSVQVRRRFPHALTLQVTEREPVAVVNLGLLYYLDSHGEVFKPLNQGDRLDYPVVTGVSEEDLAKDAAGSAEALKGAAKMVTLLAEAREGLTLANVSEIHYDKGFGYTLFTMHGGTPVRLGNDGFPEKLSRFARIYSQLEPQMRGLEYIDLNYLDKIVVKKV